jgi:folate-dependent phosphoribosylglycinamide formyltransferase PurN
MKICGLFTDNCESNATAIWDKFWIHNTIKHHGQFSSKDEREEYFYSVGEIFSAQWINLLIYAGFMRIVPQFFAKKFPGINSHPADLLVKDDKWKPKYVGMPALRKAVEDGQTTICCSCCVIDTPVDTGLVISQSERIPVSKRDLDDLEALHARLKEKEHLYYPETVSKLARGEIISKW